MSDGQSEATQPGVRWAPAQPLTPAIDTRILTVAVTTPLSTVTASWARTQTDCALVVDGGQLVGIFTHEDWVRLSAAEPTPNPAAVAINQVMVHPVISLTRSAATPLDRAMSLLAQHHIQHLPILDGQGCPIGLITPTTILSVLAQSAPPHPYSSPGRRLGFLLSALVELAVYCQHRWVFSAPQSEF